MVQPAMELSLKINLGRKFLCIVGKCFPKIHPLHKIFNRHTLKLSYSCNPLSHRTTCHATADPITCWMQLNECPLEDQCLQTNVVYQATVTSEASTESYVGLATNFKERCRNHNASFRHTSNKNETELSKHIWTLKDAKKPFKLNEKC